MAVSDIIAESKQVLGYKEAKHLQTNLYGICFRK